MPTARRLRPADELIEPLVAALADELGAPAADLPLIALARRLADTIDGMPEAVAQVMLQNFSGPLTKALVELEARASRRRAAERPAGRVNKVAQIRGAR